MEELVLLRIDIFEKLQGIIRDGARHRVNRNTATIQIQMIKSQLESTNETLSHRQTQFSQICNITQAKKKEWEFQCRQCKSNITAMEKHVQEIETTLNSVRARLFPTIVIDLLPNTKDHLDLINGSLEKLNEIISSLHDGFIAVTDMVPENPLHILHNFEDASSPEARLKKAIFDKDIDTTTICAVASGMGGVGKTCALRAIGNHKNAIERFPDGVLYMSLGAEATIDDLIRNLADFVRCSGGEQECIEIENEKKLDGAARKVAKWFHNRSCLFLVDDIWRQKGVPSAVTQMLKKIVSHKHGRLAFTTRDQDLDCDISVPFEKREVSDAEQMLLHVAGLRSQVLLKETTISIKSLIDISGGIPIALHAIGSRARNLLKYRKGIDSNSVWKVVSEEYKTAKSTFPLNISNNEKDETVLNTLYLSVKMMDEGTGENQAETLFRAFCVIKKRQQVPTHILTRLWGMSDVEAVYHINKFERFSIVVISRLSVRGNAGNCFIVHDLLLDVSKHLAELDIGFAERVCKKFISSYVGECNVQPEEQVCPSNTPPSSSQAHASMKCGLSPIEVSFSESLIELSDDGFVHSNMFRFLGIANMQREGMTLLLDPRWIAKQLRSCGWKQVESDILVILQHIDRDTQRGRKSKEGTFLKMLRAAVIECQQFIVNSDIAGVVWTQLYGRLWHYKRYGNVSQFLNDIERYATRPWYKSAGALPSPKPSLQRVFRPSQQIQMVRDSGDELEIYGVCNEEKYFSLHVYSDDVDDLKESRRWTIPDEIDTNHYDFGEICCKADNIFAVGNGQMLLVYRDSPGTNEEVHNKPTVLRFNTTKIRCVAVNKAGTVLVTGDEEGNVNIWSCADSVWTPTMLEGHENKVKAVAISITNNRIASALDDRTIRVWSFPFGEEKPSILNSDAGRVVCVSFKKDGNCIASGSSDCMVTVWSLVENTWKAVHLHGHRRSVSCVEMSESGRFVVSGSYDMTVRVWQEDNGTWKTTSIMNRNSFVRHLAISENKKRVVSFCVDGNVEVHELGGESWDTEGIDGHDGLIIYYAGSSGGTRFVTSGEDGKIRVWDWTGQAWNSVVLDVPGGPVMAFVLSDDGRKLRVEHLGRNLVCYVEKEGEWTTADVEDDSKSEECDDFEFLKRQEWPGGFKNMTEWIGMWKLPSNYFGVFMQGKPAVSFLKHME